MPKKSRKAASIQLVQSSTESPDTAAWSEFERFWSVFPRRVGKLKAQVIFYAITNEGKEVIIEGEKVLLRATADEIIAGAEKLRADVMEQIGEKWYLFDSTDRRFVSQQYIPHASTWLYQGRFYD